MSDEMFVKLKETNNIPQNKNKCETAEIIKKQFLKSSLDPHLKENESRAILQKNLSSNKELSECLEKDLTVERGNCKEKINLDNLEKRKKQKIFNRNDKLYVEKIYECDKYILYIRGKIDGYNGEQLVETKNRKKRLFNTIPIYEKVQMNIYMHMLNITECIHNESYDDESNDTNIKYDNELWDEIVTELKEVFDKAIS